MDNLKYRGQEAEVQGYTPLNLDAMQGTDVPSDFDFEELFGDIIQVEVIDENEHGEVLRDGIYLKQDVTRKMWRRGKVVLAGPKAQACGLKPGDIVGYPSDRGLQMVAAGKKKYVFLNMERLFGKLKPLKK